MTNQTYNTNDIDWKRISLKIYPKGTCGFDMYTDDGISYNYRHGEFTLTHIECTESEAETHISISRSNLLYAADEYFLEIHVNTVPERVALDGKELDCYGYRRCAEKAEGGWFFDKLNRVLYVKLTAYKENPGSLVITNGAAVGKFSENSEDERMCGQLPFLLPPASVPCRINCENYDRGGEGISYHKLTDKKSEIYRMDPVIIELCDDIGVGYNVKDMVGGEWLEYTVNVRKAGRHVFRLRIQGNARISIDINSQNCTGLIETSGNKWETVTSSSIALAEGEQVVRLSVHSGRLKANWIEIEEA